MTKTVDLNADMGEGFGDWPMGNDAAMLDIVTSANIACGFHAGDPDVMARTMAQAVARSVGMGAHPGFPDLQGFGRRRMQIPHESLANMIRYQLGAAQAMAQAAGGQLRHFKLHGALSNMACADEAMARACFEAALQIDPTLILMVLPGTALQSAADDLGAQIACEVFADRAYNDDCTLVDRSLPHAMVHDPAEAAARMVDMVANGVIIAHSGVRIPMPIDTICVHGDSAPALAIARAVKSALTQAGVVVQKL